MDGAENTILACTSIAGKTTGGDRHTTFSLPLPPSWAPVLRLCVKTIDVPIRRFFKTIIESMHSLNQCHRRIAVGSFLILAIVGSSTFGDQPEKPVTVQESATTQFSLDPAELAKQVTIYRDPWGIAHVDADNDPAAAFGFAYAQAEDYFWQVEDSCILGLGRYSEVYGEKGRGEDLLNRAFRIIPNAKADYANCDDEIRRFCEAGAAGLNYYLTKHPEVKPRLIKQFEGWQILASNRHLIMSFQLLTKGLPHSYMSGKDPSIPGPPMGSNAWAIGPSRTKNGSTILFCNPHQPQFGYGQMYEGHVRSGAGWDMTGATFFGALLPAMGHNEYLGWSHTVNRPDNVDYWTVTFDHPTNPNMYRFDGDYREAEVWTDSLLIKRNGELVEETETFRRTVHGPIVGKLSETEYVAMNIAGVNDAVLVGQHLQMVRAKNLEEFKAAMRPLQLPIFNTVYADREGNIYFVYNGTIPKRDPGFDYEQKLSGSDPRNQWQGIHDFDELPQVQNPSSGWLQSCNSSPYTSTDVGSPSELQYPEYIANDRNADNLRSKVSRLILRELDDATLDSVVDRAFDTLMYWPLVNVPRYRQGLAGLQEREPELAGQVRPLLDHLADWDFRNSHDCTQSTLVEEWYNLMYGTLYPPEGRMTDKCAGNIDTQYRALVAAAKNVKDRHGDWKVKWGDVHRLQRHTNVADLIAVPFSDKKPSLPCAGVPGGLGAVFTQYYTPSIFIPVLRETRNHYGVLGTTYIAVFEMNKEGIQGVSLTNFGSSSHEESPHYFDQAKLHSEQRFRPSLFQWDQIRDQAVRTYHPGDKATKR